MLLAQENALYTGFLVRSYDTPYMHGHIRRYGDYELEVEEVPPPIAEEALTTLFERITERGTPAADGKAVLEAR